MPLDLMRDIEFPLLIPRECRDQSIFWMQNRCFLESFPFRCIVEISRCISAAEEQVGRRQVNSWIFQRKGMTLMEDRAKWSHPCSGP